MLKLLRRLLDGPDPTPHQAWRLRMLCERLADHGGVVDSGDAYRHLKDALKIGLRRGFVYTQDAQEIVGLTAKGYALIGREEPAGF